MKYSIWRLQVRSPRELLGPKWVYGVKRGDLFLNRRESGELYFGRETHETIDMQSVEAAKAQITLCEMAEMDGAAIPYGEPSHWIEREAAI